MKENRVQASGRTFGALRYEVVRYAHFEVIKMLEPDVRKKTENRKQRTEDSRKAKDVRRKKEDRNCNFLCRGERSAAIQGNVLDHFALLVTTG